MPKRIESILCRSVPKRWSIEAEKYHRWEYLNASSLVQGLRGNDIDPMAVKLEFEKAESAATDAMDRGTLAHLLILEPHLVNSRVAVWDGDVRRGAAYDGFEELHAGKLIVRRRDFEQVTVGAAVAATNETVRKLLDGCQFEQSYIWQCGDVACKGRVDAVSDIRPMGTIDIVDIKTTHAIDTHSCQRTVRNLFYREKMAWYRMGVHALTEHPKEEIRCALIFVKLEPPYGVNIMRLSTECLDVAERKCLTVVEAVQHAIRHNAFRPVVIESEMGIDAWEEEEIHV